MAKESPLTDSMKVKKILVGITIGLFVGLVLECLKTLWMSWRPWTQFSSIFISLPLGTLVAVAGIIGCCIGIGATIREYTRRCLVSKFEYLPICAADFIMLVIKKMRYRRKVQADVQAELAGHFEDELRDKKAQELIEDFGDVKLLAVLLRRAKKRCRPLWRTIVARTFQTIGILILCLIVYLVWFLTGKPVVTVDYVAELNRIVRPATDESLNAAPLYHKAAQLYGKPSDDFLLFFAQNYKAFTDEKFPHREKDIAEQIRELFAKDKNANFNEEKQKIQERVAKRLLELLRKKYHEVTVGEKKFIQRWLQDQKEALELVIAGSKKPYYWRKYSNRKEEYGMMGILLPHLSEFRKLAKALRWKAWLQTEQGQYEDAFDDIKACYRFGQHLRGDKFFIEQLAGMAIERLTIQALLNVLSEHKINSATLAALQNDFEQIIADKDFSVSFKFAKLCLYDEIQRCFTEDRIGSGHISLEGFRRFQVLEGLSSSDYDLFEGFLTKSLHVLFTHPNKQESREMVDRYYDTFWDKITRKTPAQIQAENIDIEKQAMELVKGNILLEILTPAIGRVCKIAYRNKIDVEATLTVIAILRYRQDTGDYQENLEELITAGYLKKIPLDLFSDKPLVYKKTDDDFILYSVGYDFEDDGGEVYRDDKGRVRPWADEGDWVFWSVRK